jgi:hypothetical protein
MKQTDRMLPLLEPPRGGWARLRARRDATIRWSPSWWALASGSAAAVVWLMIASGQTDVRMPLTGARLVGEPSQGAGVQLLQSGHAVSVPSADPNVQIYWIESADSQPAKMK